MCINIGQVTNERRWSSVARLHRCTDFKAKSSVLTLYDKGWSTVLHLYKNLPASCRRELPPTQAFQMNAARTFAWSGESPEVS